MTAVMDPEVPTLVSKISELGRQVEQTSKTDAGSAESREYRRALLKTSRKLSDALRNEGQIVEDYLYSTIDVLLLKIGADLGVFDKIANNAKPISLHELTQRTNADNVLLARIMRGLASIQAVDETDVEVYAPNKVTRAFTTVKGISGLDLFHNVIHEGWMTFPKYFQETAYQNSKDNEDMPFNKKFNANGEHYFDWLGRQPKLLHSFHQFMTTQRLGHPQWLDFYPLDQLFSAVDTSDKNAVLFVDVGGSVGHECRAVHARYPNHPGRLILQDKPATIDRVAPEGFEAMKHDFFTEQPIKGARAYYFRSVLHDWDDEMCRKILNHIKDAMRPGYSKILINEFNIPLKDPCSFATHSDFFVMSLNAAVERTERQWYNLIDSVGMQIEKVWTLEPDAESLLEVTIKQ